MADTAGGVLAENARVFRKMKLSVSNIAWQHNEFEYHLNLLRELGCDGVEIAPSCIWSEPIDISLDDINNLKKLVLKYNLEIPAFQALLFTRPDLYMFGSKEKRLETIFYLKELIRLAGRLSVKTLIYGSPKSRMIGNRPYKECYEIAVETFRELAVEAEKHNTVFCIEPLESSMTDFVNTSNEGYKLTIDVGHPNFGLHLDARAMHAAGEDFQLVFQRYGSIMKHFHVGDPDLTPPGSTGRIDHSVIGKALMSSSYNEYVSLEMRKGFGSSEKMIRDAVRYVRQNYMKESLR